MSEPADRKEQFDLLYGDLRSFHEGFVDSAIKVAGFQIIVAGWLITSKDAQEVLKSSTAVTLIGVAALLLGSFIYSFIAFRVYRYSQHTFKLMGQLEYMPSTHYETRVVKRITLILFVSANFLLTLVSCFLASWHLFI